MQKIKTLREFFTDSDGMLSSTRLVMVISVVFFFANWAYSVITTGEFNPSPELTGFVTFTVFGKVIQSFSEARNRGLNEH